MADLKKSNSSVAQSSNKKRVQLQRPRCVCVKSGCSLLHPTVVTDGHNGTAKKTNEEKPAPPDPPEPSGVSMRSDRSKAEPPAFSDGRLPSGQTTNEEKPAPPDPPEPSGVSMRSDRSKAEPPAFSGGRLPSGQDGPDECAASIGQSSQKQPTGLDCIIMSLEENLMTFMKNELKRIRRVLSSDFAEVTAEDEEVGGSKEDKHWRNSRAPFLKITRLFLRGLEQDELAASLQSKTHELISQRKTQRKLKQSLKKKFQFVFEGVAKAGNPTLLNQIFTELYITEGGHGEVNEEHEVRQIEVASRKIAKAETTIRCQDLFKVSPGRQKPIRSVMTKGVAGIGKTFLTQKFTLDWAEDNANKDIQFTFPFTFRELNVLKDRKFSLVELVHRFFKQTKEGGTYSFDKPQVLFIFDGLDECRLPLDFHNNPVLTDPAESTSVDVLLTNLIRGKLLPSARLWITTRPAAANQIPPECVDMVTEVRGFTDPQKDEYFRRRFRDEEQADRIISHIKTSRSLHIMCHIPVFCWISATVLEEVLKTRRRGGLPKTLTEMYIHFLVVQTKLKNIKYDGGAGTDPHWSQDSGEMIESLGKLAFEQLQKGNLIFYESDLTECGIDIRAASVYSGVFTQIFKEERGLYQEKVFCFVHLSVQEFLAALHVHLTFIKSGFNLISEGRSTSGLFKVFKNKPKLTGLHQSAVDEALQSPNGHLDLFLRFLLGLSLKSNQASMQGLLKHVRNAYQGTQRTVQYIKEMIRTNHSPERSFNLFHCLNELNDRSLVEEIQQALSSGRLSTDKLSPAQWSTLVFILLSSEKDLEVFDLRKYSASEEALLRLLPVVKASNKALLSGCDLSQRSCQTLADIFSSKSCSLTEVDLSVNKLGDSGVMLLRSGLASPNCRLETLSLNYTNLSKDSCLELTFALSSKSPLRNLYLSYNNLHDAGLKLLCIGLNSPLCELEGLRLIDCNLTVESCRFLAAVLSSCSSSLRELDLSFNHLGDSGVKLICTGLQSLQCKLETLRLRSCGLSGRSCMFLASVIRSKSSHLRVLDLSDNELLDSGVQELTDGLRSPHCQLKALSLSGCQVAQEGCVSLASALSANPRCLKELDLSYNHPGDSHPGVKHLFAAVKDQFCRLDTLRVNHGGAQRLQPSLFKYATHPTLDRNTADIDLVLSDKEITGVTCWTKQGLQVQCMDGLTGRCYWEVEWKGFVCIGVTYKEMVVPRLGGRNKSWIVTCSEDSCSAWHNDKGQWISRQPVSHRVGVYLDWPAGTLSFFSVTSDTWIKLHTFHHPFTEPVYPAFRIRFGSSKCWSSMSLW